MNSSPTINLYIVPGDIQAVSNGQTINARNNTEGVNHLVQVSFPITGYEIVPSIVNLGLFSVTRRQS